MRFVHATLMTILILFAAAQYNDPDWYYWGPIYLLAAAWSWLALWRPERFVSWPVARIGAPISIALFLAGFVSLASYIGPGWIHIEEARESLGYLICAATTAFSLWEGRLRARKLISGAARQAQG
jgi:hypothetical protein